MNIELDIQIATQNSDLPSKEQFYQWVSAVLTPYNKPYELTIRIVEQTESQQLNHQYRHKDKPTNVLSFPFEVPEGIDLNLLGDLVVCADIVEQEAQQQHKTSTAHWAHMITHGCLHLLGYDHISESEANEMEALEIKILAQQGYENPYEY